MVQPESHANNPSIKLRARGRNIWLAALLAVMIAASAVVAPMCFLGNSQGHDLQPQLASWMDAAAQWPEGIIFPRWNAGANYDYGEPRFIFYPPASWIIGAALGSVAGWKLAPGLFVWVVVVFAGLSTWKLAREQLPAKQSIIAAVVYAANPYHLLMIYYRSSFAELLASAIFPLMIWGFLSTMREGWRRVPLLAIAFAGIWLANAPAGVIATYSLALLIVIACLLRRRLAPLLRGGVAMIAGFGLAAFYILPAAWEQRWVQIARAATDTYNPERNFLFARINDPEFLAFNWRVSTLAAAVMGFTALAIALSARWRRFARDDWWLLVALAGTATFLMFPPSAWLWRYLPELKFLQFPWRWLGPLSFCFAFFAALAARGKKRWLWLLMLAAVLCVTSTTIAADSDWGSEDIDRLTADINSGKGFDGIEGFQPINSNTDELDDESPRVDVYDSSADESSDDEKDDDAATEPQISIQQWTAERKIFSVTATQRTTLALRLLHYPAWKLEVDGRVSEPSIDPENGRMLVTLEAGTHRVEVHFVRTVDRTVGGAISLVFALGLLSAVVIAHRPSRRDSSAAHNPGAGCCSSTAD
jgi:hypothetical protein